MMPASALVYALFDEDRRHAFERERAKRAALLARARARRTAARSQDAEGSP
jgi:hypothetical protein